MQSSAATVAEYLKQLPEDRRAAISKVRSVIRKNLPKGFAEQMTYGMIGYVVPHKLYPPGYHCNPEQPLPYACLASQKNYMSLYLMSIYGDGELARWMREQFQARGKKLDIGKSCIRFKKIEDLPLDVIAEALSRVSVDAYIERVESARKRAPRKKRK
jgi:hypothetical protein